MVTTTYASITFAVTLPTPRGAYANTLDIAEGYTMVRDGDTLIVTCDIPENEGRGFPVRTVRHYNWAAVAYGTPMPEKVTSANKR